MFYTYCDKSGSAEHSTPKDLGEAEVPGAVAGLSDHKKVLYIWRDERDHLELAATMSGIYVSEVYGPKRLHLRGRLEENAAVALIQEYRKESIANAADWYPTLLEWRGLRFSRPRLFALLNERYKVKNVYVMAFVIGIGIIILIGCFSLGTLLRIRSKLIFAPLVLYALLLAKRVEFSDPSEKRYGYGS